MHASLSPSISWSTPLPARGRWGEPKGDLEQASPDGGSSLGSSLRSAASQRSSQRSRRRWVWNSDMSESEQEQPAQSERADHPGPWGAQWGAHGVRRVRDTGAAIGARERSARVHPTPVRAHLPA